MILRKYNEATTVFFPLIDRGTMDFESTPVTFVAADTQFNKDGGSFGDTDSIPTHSGNGIYMLSLTATEMTAARIMVTVIDAATKEWEDQAIPIETYGNPSAQHAVDLDDAVRAGLTALPNAAAEAAGGLYTRGSGAGQIIQPSDGLININVSRINASAAAAIRLALSAGQMIPGTVDDTVFTPTTQVFEADDITEATTSHFVGRLILWTTGALTGQMARIQTYILVGSNGRFTVSIMTEAPADNDTFIVI